MNKAILVGNLGQNPEVRRTPAGKTVATFSLATHSKYTDANGERQNRTEWHNVVTWGKRADVVAKYLSKGDGVSVEGEIRTRNWEHDGRKYYKTEIHASNVEFVSVKPKNNQSDGYSQEELPIDAYVDEAPF